MKLHKGKANYDSIHTDAAKRQAGGRVSLNNLVSFSQEAKA